MVDEFTFFNFFIPQDQWDSPFTLELSTLDETKVGNYTATIEVKLAKYTMPAPIFLKIPLIVLPKPVNNLPYFDPKLPTSATIQKTLKQDSWTLSLPKIIDKDPTDVVRVKADFG